MGINKYGINRLSDWLFHRPSQWFWFDSWGHQYGTAMGNFLHETTFDLLHTIIFPSPRFIWVCMSIKDRMKTSRYRDREGGRQGGRERGRERDYKNSISIHSVDFRSANRGVPPFLEKPIWSRIRSSLKDRCQLRLRCQLCGQRRLRLCLRFGPQTWRPRGSNGKSWEGQQLIAFFF